MISIEDCSLADCTFQSSSVMYVSWFSVSVCLSVCLSVLCTCFCLVLCVYLTLRWFSVSEWWGAGVVICLERDADLHMVQLMPLPLTVSCFSKIQTGFTFLVPADLGSPGQRAVKRVCVWGGAVFSLNSLDAVFVVEKL